MSTKQAAEYLGVKPETIKYHVYTSKKLKPVIVGHSAIFTQQQLDDFCSARKEKGATNPK